LMLSASATEEPPYFCTTKLTANCFLTATTERPVYRRPFDGSGRAAP